MADRFELGAYHYAHRGLWTSDGPAENSLTAFRAAAEAGYGIEFDVRPDCNGQPIVFHDETLDRMTNRSGAVADHSTDELQAIKLVRSSDSIPSLDDLLSWWPSELPFLCELKIDGKTDASRFAQTVGARLTARTGFAAAMSFSQTAVASLPKNLMRGQLIARASTVGAKTIASLIEKTEPGDADYFAAHVTDVELVSGLRNGNRPCVIWTVTDRNTHDRVLKTADAVIFEHYDPD